MKWLYKIGLALSISFFFSGQSLASRYELLIDNSNPTAGTVRLVLEGPLGTDTKLVSRQLAGTNIDHPVCATSGKVLSRQDDGWLAPAGCSEIIWHIAFSETFRPEHDVSTQDNLYYTGKWWLFSELGNLLRPASNASESKICVKGRFEICRPIPSTEEAPLLMLIGVPDKRVILGGTSFNFFTGHLPNGFNIVDLYKSYDRQLSYLYKVMNPIKKPPPPETVDVLVLGIDASLGVVGGATGIDAYLANIAVEEDGVSSSERIKHLVVAGHEMAHMLGLGTEALWASESLAHYYGFKSLGENKLASQLFNQMTVEMNGIGLLKAHLLVAQGEGQYYAQFYIKGAAFWRDLDKDITAATRGDKNLDDYLSLLVNGQFGVNGELPSDFLEAMIDVIGRKNMDRLRHEYL